MLRPFSPADVPAIVALFRDTVRRVNCRDYSPRQVLAWAPDEIDEAAWSKKLAGRYTLVAALQWQIAEQPRIVSFGDLESSSLDSGGHLGHLYVHADCQRCGVGRKLLSALETEARRLGVPRIFTEASITARPFFEYCGYRLIQEQVVVFHGVEFVNYQMDKQL
ncbi:MAG: GNAT family N-acetyltransferase [Planctomycetes bacterium]|nr:GNAT family N-acetyltransferase [Planctomycetota bacterium]